MKTLLVLTVLLMAIPLSLDAQAGGYDGASDVAADNLGNVYVTGTSIGAGGRIAMATVAYDSSGTELWSVRADNGGSGGGSAIAVSPKGAITVAGWLRLELGGTDIELVGYAPAAPSGIRLASREQRLLHLELVPSGGNGAVDVRLSLDGAGRVELGLYDLLGRRVATIVDADLEPGRYQFPLPAPELPAGAYIARLVTGDKCGPKRMMTSIVLLR